MLDNGLETISNGELDTKSTKIIDMDNVDDYLFIILDNEQKILTNGKNLYNVSDYSHLLNI